MQASKSLDHLHSASRFLPNIMDAPFIMTGLQSMSGAREVFLPLASDIKKSLRNLTDASVAHEVELVSFKSLVATCSRK